MVLQCTEYDCIVKYTIFLTPCIWLVQSFLSKVILHCRKSCDSSEQYMCNLLFVVFSWTLVMTMACWWGAGVATTATEWRPLPGLAAQTFCSATPAARCLSATLSAGSTPPFSTPVRSFLDLSVKLLNVKTEKSQAQGDEKLIMTDT